MGRSRRISHVSRIVRLSPMRPLSGPPYVTQPTLENHEAPCDAKFLARSAHEGTEQAPEPSAARSRCSNDRSWSKGCSKVTRSTRAAAEGEEAGGSHDLWHAHRPLSGHFETAALAGCDLRPHHGPGGDHDDPHRR